MHGADPSNPYHYKTHFLQFLENEQNLDILFLKFEDFDQNPEEAVREIQQYLGIKRKLRSSQMARVLVNNATLHHYYHIIQPYYLLSYVNIQPYYHQSTFNRF